MTIKQAKKINLADFLNNIGYSPVKRRGDNLWYLSPIRNENTASFKVNISQNLWYDFGIGCGGSIIDLAIFLYHSNDFSYILGRIERNAPIRTSYMPSFPKSQKNPGIQNVQTQILTAPSLLEYLNCRCVDIDIAKKQCVEVHFLNNGKSYSAIGFHNIVDGYELRNQFYKGCIAPKHISMIANKEGNGTCRIFEGFMDYLSYLTLLKSYNTSKSDYVILNSTMMVRKSIPYLKKFSTVYCYLDNDVSGQEATKMITDSLDSKVVDHSFSYSHYNDVNDYLCNMTNR